MFTCRILEKHVECFRTILSVTHVSSVAGNKKRSVALDVGDVDLAAGLEDVIVVHAEPEDP